MGRVSIGGVRRPGGRARALFLLSVVLATLCATHVGAEIERRVRGRVLAGGRPAANVVVWFEAPDAPRRAAQKVILDQRNLKFSPQVLAVRVGTEVHFPNNDRVFHNVFSFTNGKPFDLGLYPTGASKHITLDRAAVNRLYCNIHPHMAAYIVAVDSPYYATSDRTGRFAIDGVPPGRYTYHAWRSGAETLTATVAVGEGAALEVSWR
jgi:plastocyanin